MLFASLASANAGTTTSVLFGNLLAISRDQLLVYGLFTAAVVLTLALIARPLVFASVDPAVAEEPDDLLLVAQVEVGQRLVEQQQFGVVDDRLGDGDPLLLAAGELGHPAVGVVERARVDDALRRVCLLYTSPSPRD